MNTTLTKTLAVWILAPVVLMALTTACSDDPPPPATETPAASVGSTTPSDSGTLNTPPKTAPSNSAPAASSSQDTTPAAQPEVDILQSDRKFITIALSPYGSSIHDIDPSTLHPWCTHPDAETIVIPPNARKSPPVPQYPPEGVAFYGELRSPDGSQHIVDKYRTPGGMYADILINVGYASCLITKKDPELVEPTTVADTAWGVFLLSRENDFDILTLWVETDLGPVQIRRIDTDNKGRVGKDELIKIAESMPIFANSTPAASSDDDILVSALGFIKVGLNGKDAYDIYPTGVHESCISPGPGYPPPAQPPAGSPPLPVYLPEGVSLDKESHIPNGGRHFGNIYVGKGSVNNNVRITVSHGSCTSLRVPSGHPWELSPLAGSWGIFYQEAGNDIANLTLETESGFVEIRSVHLGAKRNPVGKDELIKIAESMPIFTNSTPTASSSQDTTPTEPPKVEILQSDRKFITIALSPYRSSIHDIDPSARHPWCTPPDAQTIVIPPNARKSPPVPQYLPEGISHHSEFHADGNHLVTTYTSHGGNGNHIRLNVRYGPCLITNKAPELIEPTSVAGNWGVFLSSLKGGGTFDLSFETDLGIVVISRVATEGIEETVGKDELIKIAESMPIFANSAPVAVSSDDDILVSALGFIKVGLNGKDAYDVYPTGVHEWCKPLAPYPPRPPKIERGSPPLPEYLPEGMSLDQESHAPDGAAHIGNVYKGGAYSGLIVTVRHGGCAPVIVPSDHPWELTPLPGSWGIFFHESGNTILNLTLETESGFVEIRSVHLGANQNPVGKDELIKIAESMPIFTNSL